MTASVRFILAAIAVSAVTMLVAGVPIQWPSPGLPALDMQKGTQR